MLTEQKKISYKENRNDSTGKDFLNHQIEQLQKSIKSSSKDDMEIYNYQ